MEKRCFYFLLVIFSFTSQVEGMFFEQSVTATIKIARSNAVLNSLNQSFKHRGLNVRAFSEGLHTSRSSSSTYVLQSPATSHRYDQNRKYPSWHLLLGGASIIAALSCDKVFASAHTEGTMDLNKELEKELLVGYKKIKNIINLHEVVLVVGNTGVAKSTIIAYLMGAELEEHTLGITKQQVLRIKGDSEKYPIINSNPGIRSQTLYPEIFSAGNGINFCDFPGFYETRGVQHKVTQAVSLECILRSKTRKKLVVVCTYEEIQNLVGFATLMSDIDSRFGKGTANSVFFVITKANEKIGDVEVSAFVKSKLNELESSIDTLKKRLQLTAPNAVDPFTEDMRKDLANKETNKKILELFKPDNLFVFSNGKYTPETRENFFQKLKNIKPVSAFGTNESNYLQMFRFFSQQILMEGVSLLNGKKYIEDIIKISKKWIECAENEGPVKKLFNTVHLGNVSALQKEDSSEEVKLLERKNDLKIRLDVLNTVGLKNIVLTQQTLGELVRAPSWLWLRQYRRIILENSDKIPFYFPVKVRIEGKEYIIDSETGKKPPGFTHWHAIPEKGIFKAEYSGEVGEDPLVTVTLSKDERSYQSVTNSVTEELRYIDKSIKAINDRKELLEKTTLAKVLIEERIQLRTYEYDLNENNRKISERKGILDSIFMLRRWSSSPDTFEKDELAQSYEKLSGNYKTV